MADPLMSVKVELAAKAEASLNIKGEVSTSALDRIAHAFVDAVSPFTERRGLKGDMLRLQRTEIAALIAETAKKKVENWGETVGPVPIKVLSPLLESASLEGNADTKMIDWWSSLLAETSIDPRLHHPVLSDVMSKITSREVRFLNNLVTTFLSPNHTLADTSFSLRAAFVYEVVNPLVEEMEESKSDPISTDTPRNEAHYDAKARELLGYFMVYLKEVCAIVLYIDYPAANFTYSENISGLSDKSRLESSNILDVLLSVGIFRREMMSVTMPTGYIGEFSCSIDVIRLTSIGRQLVSAGLRDELGLRSKI